MLATYWATPSVNVDPETLGRSDMQRRVESLIASIERDI